MPEGWNSRDGADSAFNHSAPKMMPIPRPVDTGMTVEAFRQRQQQVEDILRSANGFGHLGKSVESAVLALLSAVTIQAELIEDLTKKLGQRH